MAVVGADGILRGLQSLLLRPLRFGRYLASFPGHTGGSSSSCVAWERSLKPLWQREDLPVVQITQSCISEKCVIHDQLPTTAPGCSSPAIPFYPKEFYGSMRQIKTSPMKLNLVAKLIRGMCLSEALAQVEFCQKKPARFVQMTLLDTQRRAVQNHDVEPLNLWVAESYVGKGQYLKRPRYHGKGMHGIMHKYYAHYFLKLREGLPPPKNKRRIEDHKSRKTRKLIEEGPRGIPNSL